MEENSNIEQPHFEPDNQAENQYGSNLGKFKDVQTLLNAYNSLQAEFTRKSQKLAELQKENDKNAIFSYNDSIDEVLKDETDNDKYKKEITEILNNDELINNLPNKNHVAFKIIKNTEKNIENKINSQEFIDEYIKNNSAICNSIISDYLSKLNNIPANNNYIPSNGNVYFSPNTNKPTNLKEAGEIFSKMLK